MNEIELSWWDSKTVEWLLKKEADISVRSVNPSEGDLAVDEHNVVVYCGGEWRVLVKDWR